VAKLGRPTKPLISKENAIRVALEVIDEQGLEALSLERVAKGIGVRAPSLYHHFHNKAELLTEVARSVLAKIEAPTNLDATWEEQFLDLCLATRKAMLRHPRAGLLLLQYFPRNLLLSAYDHWTSKCPYPVEVQMLILDGGEKITFGSSFFAAAAAAYATPVMPAFSTQKFPALAAAVENNPHDDEQMFAETIQVFLAGLKSRYGEMATNVESQTMAKTAAQGAG
jgi:AcrR family transcriptional regulator